MYGKRTVVGIAVVVAALVLIGGGVPGRAAASGAQATEGAIHSIDLDTLRSLGSVTGAEVGEEFGTVASERFLATAPGAAGGGRVYLFSGDDVASSSSATELSARQLERFGESWADLGHPPGVSNALAIGAPSVPAGANAPAAAAPNVVVAEFNNARFVRTVRTVRGPAGSLFGWRVESTDSQFPQGSFFGSFVVTAPLEGKGKKRGSGAVYKYDAQTGKRIWVFRGQPGEHAGYDLDLVSDQDGDGSADFLVGAPGSRDRDPAGRMYLLSGADGSVIDTIEAPDDAVLFGFAVRGNSALSALPGFLVSAPATAKGRKDNVGTVYHYESLDAAPRVFQGKRRDQWFGVSTVASASHLFVGSFEGSRNAKRDRRGSVTVLAPNGRIARTLRGKKAGEHFGRSLTTGAALLVGAPGAPPLFVPE